MKYKYVWKSMFLNYEESTSVCWLLVQIVESRKYKAYSLSFNNCSWLNIIPFQSGVQFLGYNPNMNEYLQSELIFISL